MLIAQRYLSAMLSFILAASSVGAPAQSFQEQDSASPTPAPPPATAEPAKTPTPPAAAGTLPVRPAKALLRAGSEVPLKFAQSVHSRVSKPGDTIELALAEDLKVEDALVARKGARVIGKVTRTNNPNSRGKGGELYLQVEFLKVGRSMVKLRGEGGGKEGSHTCWGCVAVSTAMYGVVGALFAILGTAGKQYVIKGGTPITAYVAEDIELPLQPE